MRKINLLHFLIAIIAICMMAACGGGKGGVPIKTEKNSVEIYCKGDIEVEGDLKANIVLSDKNPALLTLSEDQKVLTIKFSLELVNSMLNSQDYEYELWAEVYDENERNINFGEYNYNLTAQNYNEIVNPAVIEKLKGFLLEEKGSKTELEIDLILRNPASNILDLLANSKFYKVHSIIRKIE